MTGEGRVSFLIIVVAGFVLANTLPMTWIPLLLWLGILWILGIILLVWKKQESYSGWWMGAAYWILMGWKGDEVRQGLYLVALEYWNGDGSMNWMLLTLAVTILYAVAGIKMCHRFSVPLPQWLTLPMGALTRSVKKAMGQDWELIEFQLGVDRTSEITSEPFRPGGE
jgi:hypothetical protein